MLTRATVLQYMNIPKRNCVNTPRMMHSELVAVSAPRRCGCVISATYVSTWKTQADFVLLNC